MIILVMIYEEFNRDIPPFPLLYVGGALKRAGYKVKILHIGASKIDENVERIVRENPIFVGFSVITGLPTVHSAMMSKKIKERSNIPVVWGGIHASLLPESCLEQDYVDIVVIGEGEETTVELAERVTKKGTLGDIKGIGYKRAGSEIIINPGRPLIKDLTPHRLDFNLVDMQKYVNNRFEKTDRIEKRIVTIDYISSRGCPHSCGFCYNQKYNQARWRAYPIDVVLEDIEFLKNEYSLNAIHFWDDNFFANKGRAIDILKKVDLIPSFEIRLDYITDDLARELKTLKTSLMLIGCESGSNRILKLVNKGFTKEDMLEKIAILSKYDLPALYSFILGVPTETKEEFKETLDLMFKIHKLHRRSSFTVGMYLPYPGTDLYQLAIREGFSPPCSPEGWSLVDRWRNTVPLPWIDQKVCLNVRHLFAILSLNIQPINKWVGFRIRHRFLRFSYDIKAFILLHTYLNKIINRFNKRKERRYIDKVFIGRSKGKLKVARFGEMYKYDDRLTFFGRLGFYIHGTPFVGGYIRSLYFKKCIMGMRVNRILDAGCGSGEYAFYLSQKCPDVKIDACDIQGIDHCIELQRKVGVNNINFFQQNLHDLTHSEKYDLIYSINVLEHIRDNKEVIKRFYNSIKKGGFLYLDLPQKNWWEVHIFNPKRFKAFNEFVEREHVGEQYTMCEMIEVLEDIGLRIVEAKKTFGVFGKLAWEVDQLLQANNLGRTKAMTLPILKLFGYLDTILPNRRGSGFFILAQR